ncbi:TauD/TfdA family dioxygenase [Actinoallomurus sp. CA-142502]|uniref:TauD/TfdA family dioxygenase n=1 Tax=Actinoallomurus sp. CA-142502 TaxID=3239885 RepID=UPI003D8B0775
MTVDLRADTWRDTAIELLATCGLVMFTGLRDRNHLLRVARRLVTIRPHRSAGADGVSVIADRADQRSGYTAYSTAALPPHTDGTAMPNPAHLIILACQEQAGAGGESLAIDGQAVYRTLAAEYPSELKELCRPNSAVFNGLRSSVFAQLNDGRVVVRCRFDELVQYDPAVASILAIFKAVIAKHTETVRLRPGEGYIIDNSRWAHGRAQFTGTRVMLRVLGDPLPDARLPLGFMP